MRLTVTRIKIFRVPWYVKRIEKRFQREFKTRIPNRLGRSQKNRVRKQFVCFNIERYCYSLFSLNSYNLYVNRLRSLNLFLKRRSKGVRRMSRKNRYRKLTGDEYMLRRFINKKKIQIFGFDVIKSGLSDNWTFRGGIKRSWRRRVMRFSLRRKQNYICLNLRKIPFTRKPIGSRMGKGKGSIRAWFTRIRPGRRVITLMNWRTRNAFFLCRALRLYLPGKNYVVRPVLHNRRELVQHYSSYF